MTASVRRWTDVFNSISCLAAPIQCRMHQVAGRLAVRDWTRSACALLNSLWYLRLRHLPKCKIYINPLFQWCHRLRWLLFRQIEYRFGFARWLSVLAMAGCDPQGSALFGTWDLLIHLLPRTSILRNTTTSLLLSSVPSPSSSVQSDFICLYNPSVLLKTRWNWPAGFALSLDCAVTRKFTYESWYIYTGTLILIAFLSVESQLCPWISFGA